MKPYGNEHMYFGDELNSSKHWKKRSSVRRACRRINKKKTRAKAKALLHLEGE